MPANTSLVQSGHGDSSSSHIDRFVRYNAMIGHLMGSQWYGVNAKWVGGVWSECEMGRGGMVEIGPNIEFFSENKHHNKAQK